MNSNTQILHALSPLPAPFRLLRTQRGKLNVALPNHHPLGALAAEIPPDELIFPRREIGRAHV